MSSNASEEEGSWNFADHPDGTRKAVSEPTARRVWIAAGGRCTFCGKNLLVDEFTGQQVLVGQLAHIVGATPAPGSPRGQDPLPTPRRADADNLILLCHDQHRVIDDKSLWEVYSADDLRQLKRAHEDHIRSMTEMTIERSSTAIRLVSAVGEVPVDLSDQTVVEALFERGSFPDFKLRGAGDEFEINLRGLPGEDGCTDLYWQAGAEKVRELGPKLTRAVSAGLVRNVSVLAIARIPFLIELGNVLGEALKVDLYPARKEGRGGFGWTDEEAPLEFRYDKIREGRSASGVAVIVSVTGDPGISDLPADVDDDWLVYKLTTEDGRTAPGLDRSEQTINNFHATWSRLLAELESLRGVASVALFPAVPVTLAITLGRCLVRGRSPALRVYDRAASGDFVFASEVAR